MISYFRVMKATTRTDAPWSNFRGFIKGQAPGKLAACDYSFSDRPWAHQGVFFFFFFFVKRLNPNLNLWKVISLLLKTFNETPEYLRTHSTKHTQQVKINYLTGQDPNCNTLKNLEPFWPVTLYLLGYCAINIRDDNFITVVPHVDCCCAHRCALQRKEMNINHLKHQMSQ